MQLRLSKANSNRSSASHCHAEVRTSHGNASCCHSLALKVSKSHFNSVPVSRPKRSHEPRRWLTSQSRSCISSVMPHQTAHTEHGPVESATELEVDDVVDLDISSNIPSRSAVQREDTITAIVTGEVFVDAQDRRFVRLSTSKFTRKICYCLLQFLSMAWSWRQAVKHSSSTPVALLSHCKDHHYDITISQHNTS